MNHSKPETGRGASTATKVKRAALATLFAVVLGTIYGCWDSSEAASPPARPGTQASAWGAPYPNMPDFAPPQVRASEYAAVAAAELGPPIDPAKGYRTENFGGGVYMVTEGTYQAMIVVSDQGVILVDAPPNIGANLLKAVNDVAPGAKVVEMIYSHAHVDHIGYAGEILKSNPSMAIAAHEETRKLLARAQDSARPVPTVTFNTQDQNFPVVVGNQTLQLQYPGPNHEPGNIGIYHAGQKVLMVVDVIYPGWMMWRRFGVSHDIPGYFDLVKTMNSRWDFDHLIAGHVGRAGTKADVTQQLEFMTDPAQSRVRGPHHDQARGNGQPEEHEQFMGLLPRLHGSRDEPLCQQGQPEVGSEARRLRRLDLRPARGHGAEPSHRRSQHQAVSDAGLTCSSCSPALPRRSAGL